MNFYSSRILNALLLSSLLSSCVQTAVNIPPGMTEEEISKVYFYSAKGIDTSSIAIDGVGLGIFETGLVVTPGEHEAMCEYKFDEEKCYRGRYCLDRVYYGICRGHFRAEMGQEYAVRLRRASTSVFMSIENAKTGEPAGSGSCETTRSALSNTGGKVKF